eukprot:GILK01011968.1.p1 GENE.GILK01011968.1~~GILK01011968.1.p1  ORF type:complete len:981 (+),score=138.46 GILK01011968.1:51-2993(+)
MATARVFCVFLLFLSLASVDSKTSKVINQPDSICKALQNSWRAFGNVVPDVYTSCDPHVKGLSPLSSAFSAPNRVPICLSAPLGFYCHYDFQALSKEAMDAAECKSFVLPAVMSNFKACIRGDGTYESCAHYDVLSSRVNNIDQFCAKVIYKCQDIEDLNCRVFFEDDGGLLPKTNSFSAKRVLKDAAQVDACKRIVDVFHTCMDLNQVLPDAFDQDCFSTRLSPYCTFEVLTIDDPKIIASCANKVAPFYLESITEPRYHTEEDLDCTDSLEKQTIRLRTKQADIIEQKAMNTELQLNLTKRVAALQDFRDGSLMTNFAKRVNTTFTAIKDIQTQVSYQLSLMPPDLSVFMDTNATYSIMRELSLNFTVDAKRISSVFAQLASLNQTIQMRQSLLVSSNASSHIDSFANAFDNVISIVKPLQLLYQTLLRDVDRLASVCKQLTEAQTDLAAQLQAKLYAQRVAVAREAYRQKLKMEIDKLSQHINQTQVVAKTVMQTLFESVNNASKTLRAEEDAKNEREKNERLQAYIDAQPCPFKVSTLLKMLPKVVAENTSSPFAKIPDQNPMLDTSVSIGLYLKDLRTEQLGEPMLTNSTVLQDRITQYLNNTGVNATRCMVNNLVNLTSCSPDLFVELSKFMNGSTITGASLLDLNVLMNLTCRNVMNITNKVAESMAALWADFGMVRPNTSNSSLSMTNGSNASTTNSSQYLLNHTDPLTSNRSSTDRNETLSNRFKQVTLPSRRYAKPLAPFQQHQQAFIPPPVRFKSMLNMNDDEYYKTLLSGYRINRWFNLDTLTDYFENVASTTRSSFLSLSEKSLEPERPVREAMGVFFGDMELHFSPTIRPPLPSLPVNYPTVDGPQKNSNEDSKTFTPAQLQRDYDDWDEESAVSDFRFAVNMELLDLSDSALRVLPIRPADIVSQRNTLSYCVLFYVNLHQQVVAAVHKEIDLLNDRITSLKAQFRTLSTREAWISEQMIRLSSF